MKCKICKSKNTRFINVNVSKCLECGTLFKNKTVDYDKEYKDYWFDLNDKKFDWYVKDQENWFNYFKDDIKKGTVMEIGGANGLIINQVNDSKIILQELEDIRPNELRNMRIKFMKGKIENVLSNIKSNSIDTFIMCNVIEHLNDVPKLLNRLYSKLKDKGRILISTDDGDNPMGGLMAQLNHTEHTVTLTKNAFNILCKDKFKITKYWNVSDYLIYTVLEKE